MAEGSGDSLSDGDGSIRSGHRQSSLANNSQERRFTIENGPYDSFPLIEELPNELEYVQCEAFDQNIYLGTSTGDLLHYFEIEPRNYMLVSQTKFNSDLPAPIDKILLLPNIERALVLSNKSLVLFLLPEFAPAPNTPTLNGITDIALRGYSSTSRSYKFYVAQAESIKLMKVSSNVITLLKKFDFESVGRIAAQGHHLAVAKENNYEMFNLKTSSVIPLFRVSEMNAPLRPVVVDFKKGEFLVATGGGSYEDSSMALVVNHNGDIVNATIVLDNYPSSVIVDYPYLIVEFKPDRVSIYQLNDEPKVAQQLVGETLELRIAEASKKFSGFKRPEIKKRVVDMIRKVPLVEIANQLKIDNERASVEEAFEEVSSKVIYGKFGVHVLVKPPPLLAFTEHNEPGMRAIEEYLQQVDDESKFKQLENQYLQTLLLLLDVLHSTKIDLKLIKRWCSKLGSVDIRIMLYVLGFRIYGSVWISNGLVALVEKLKSLKMFHKCDDVEWFLRSLSSLIKNDNSEALCGDYQNVVKTVDVNLFNVELDKHQEKIDVSVFHESSLEEIMHIIMADKNNRLDLLLQVMQRRKMYMESIELLKEKGEAKNLLTFLETNAEELPSSYNLNLIDDVLFIIEHTHQVDKKLICQIIHLLSTLRISPRKLIECVKNNAGVKALIIQELGPRDANDKQFLVDYYVAKMQEFLQNDDVQRSFREYADAYSQDISYTKCSAREFFIIKLENTKKFRDLLENYETLEALCKQEGDISLLKSVLNEIRNFDTDNILTVLFLSLSEEARNCVTEEKLLEIFIKFNDFVTIEKLLSENNIIRVLKHYASFDKRHHSLTLATKLLERNINLIRSEATVISVLQNLSADYTLAALFDPLYSILKRIGSESQQLELQKVLMKSRISAYNDFLKRIDMKESER